MRTFFQTLISLLLVCGFAPTLSAATQVFKAEALYRKTGTRSSFNDLEQMGVEREAQKTAMSLCVDAGAKDCVILNEARIIACNASGTDLYSVYCRAEARTRGEVQDPL